MMLQTPLTYPPKFKILFLACGWNNNNNKQTNKYKNTRVI